MLTRRLKLARESLRRLDATELRHAAGGRIDSIAPCGGRSEGCPTGACLASIDLSCEVVGV